MRVCTILGTRPELIRLSRVIAALDRHSEHVLIHTGQNYDYELNQMLFEDLEVRQPDHFLEAAGQTAAETIGQVIARADAVLRKIRPDAVLILGDTNSSLAALAAKRLRIPIFHMEAGNRCFDERVPEEVNRRIVDHISDINLPYSTLAREHLLREGMPPDRVIKTGSPMYEVLWQYRAKIAASSALSRLALQRGGYYLVSVHREENVDAPDQLARFLGLLKGVGQLGKPVIVSAHPRTRKRLESQPTALPATVRLMKPFGFCDYVHLQQHACAVLSDSGTITEESAILGFPALNLREAHERPEGMEEAAVMMVGMAWHRVREALCILAAQPGGTPRRLGRVRDYQAKAVSDKVVRIILSYTSYVNRVVWQIPHGEVEV